MNLVGKNITTGYGKTTVLDNVDVELPAGSITGIIGPNASGKSTLLKVLSRLKRPWRGQVSVAGRDLAKLPKRQAARTLAVLPQHPTAPPQMSVRGLVDCGRLPHVRRLGTFGDQDRRAADQALERCELQSLTERPLTTLSGGQLQRAWLAMALAQQSQVLLLDEPLTSLDINHQLEVMDLLVRLNHEQGLTVGLVIHDLNLAARFCSRLVLMDHGRIVQAGPPTEVFSSGAIEEVFHVWIRMERDPLTQKPMCHFYRGEDVLSHHDGPQHSQRVFA